MSTASAEHIINVPPNNRPIRVLLFRDRQTAELAQITGTDGAIKVVGEARNRDEALVRVARLLPDVILMITDNGTPYIDFSETIRTLCEMQLTGRVMIISRNPAGYLGMAIKARTAALLSRKISSIDLVSALRKVNILSQDSLYPVEILYMRNELYPENWWGGD